MTGWIEQGTVMVDANALADLLGGIVFWDPKTKTLTLSAGGKRFRFVQGSRDLDVDGQRVVLPLPMEANRRIPLKSVMAVLGGSVRVDLASFAVEVSLSGTSLTPAPAQPALPIPPTQSTPPSPSTPSVTAKDPGPRELYPGTGAGVLHFGMNGVEVSQILGPPDQRQIWKPIAGLLYRPVQLIYKKLGMSVLMANGTIWGVAVTSRDWVLTPYGVRVGDNKSSAIGIIGNDYQSENNGAASTMAYKYKGIVLFFQNDIIQTIVVFLPMR